MNTIFINRVIFKPILSEFFFLKKKNMDKRKFRSTKRKKERVFQELYDKI